MYQDLNFTTSFNLNYFLRDPISKYSHTTGIDLKHMNLRRGTEYKHSIQNCVPEGFFLLWPFHWDPLFKAQRFPLWKRCSTGHCRCFHCTGWALGVPGSGEYSYPTFFVSCPGLMLCCLYIGSPGVHLHECEIADRSKHQTIWLIMHISPMCLSFSCIQSCKILMEWKAGQASSETLDLC